MTRGGYLLIIGFLFGMFVYQQYAHEKMIDRYEVLILDQNCEKLTESRNFDISDSLQYLKSSFDKIVEQAKITPEKQDTIIIHNHITKVSQIIKSEPVITSPNTEELCLGNCT